MLAHPRAALRWAVPHISSFLCFYCSMGSVSEIKMNWIGLDSYGYSTRRISLTAVARFGGLASPGSGAQYQTAASSDGTSTTNSTGPRISSNDTTDDVRLVPVGGLAVRRGRDERDIYSCQLDKQ